MNIRPTHTPAPRYPALAALAVAAAMSLPACKQIFLSSCVACEGSGLHIVTDKGLIPFTPEQAQKHQDAQQQICSKCQGMGTQALGGAIVPVLELEKTVPAPRFWED